MGMVLLYPAHTLPIAILIREEIVFLWNTLKVEVDFGYYAILSTIFHTHDFVPAL
jgi:hypothetical protein